MNWLFYSSRLETRTKESNMYASLKDLNQSKEVFLFFINLFIKNTKKKTIFFGN